jgi:hypothetical protein
MSVMSIVKRSTLYVFILATACGPSGEVKMSPVSTVEIPGYTVEIYEPKKAEMKPLVPFGRLFGGGAAHQLILRDLSAVQDTKDSSTLFFWVFDAKTKSAHPINVATVGQIKNQDAGKLVCVNDEGRLFVNGYNLNGTNSARSAYSDTNGTSFTDFPKSDSGKPLFVTACAGDFALLSSGEAIYRWSLKSPGTVTKLMASPSGVGGGAAFINNQGLVAINAFVNGVDTNMAIEENGTITPITDCSVRGINNKGLILGEFKRPPPAQPGSFAPCTWDVATKQVAKLDLPAGFFGGEAKAIADNGDILGAGIKNGLTLSYVYRNGVPTILPLNNSAVDTFVNFTIEERLGSDGVLIARPSEQFVPVADGKNYPNQDVFLVLKPKP